MAKEITDMSRINKPELIDKVSKATRISKHDTEEVINHLILEIENVIADGNDVLIKGFGTFSVYESSPRKGRNIHTGEAVDIPAKKRLKFTPGDELSRKIN